MNESKRAGGIDERGRRTLGRFLHESDGFAITLTIISLPFVLAIAAWVIDASRVGNLHTDLQHAVDAMALAGARELDGRDDAIPRAQNAIAALSSNVASFADGGAGWSMGGKSIPVDYDPANAGTSEVAVHFLKSLPPSDDTPIDLAVHEVDAGTIAEQSNQALYAYVIANNQNVLTIFPLAFAGRQTVAVNAEAVATYHAAACDVTPIFVCNPFEVPGDPDGDASNINKHFREGDLYARQVTMRLESGTNAGPGNFGFLATFGQGGNVLGEALATGSPGMCYEEDHLDTKTGGTIGQVEQGLNTRMGIYKGSYSGNLEKYRPDKNVRKGQKQPPDCSTYDPEDNRLNAMAFPEAGSAGVDVIGGGTISSDANWELDLYWDITHGGHTTAPLPADDPTYDPASPLYVPPPPAPVIPMANLPPTALPDPDRKPSRYDVYLYELANPPMVDDPAPNTETGAPACYTGPVDPADDSERRVIFSAIVNCLDQADELYGTSGEPEAIGFARMFMTKPMVTSGSNKFISLEFIDITGSGGLGTLETFLREEAELVR
jgi:Flp pilus assembly protein TadG